MASNKVTAAATAATLLSLSVLLAACGTESDCDTDDDSRGPATTGVEELVLASSQSDTQNSVALPTAASLPDFADLANADDGTVTLADDCDDEGDNDGDGGDDD